jgi:hypothetical protein
MLVALASTCRPYMLRSPKECRTPQQNHHVAHLLSALLLACAQYHTTT